MLKYAVALGVAGMIGWGAVAAQDKPGCLHGASEVPAEAARRLSALRFTRAVNSAQALGRSRTQRYSSLAELAGAPQAPEGFQAQLLTDGQTYTFSVKDTLDSCYFAYFSDQAGLIYTAAPIQ